MRKKALTLATLLLASTVTVGTINTQKASALIKLDNSNVVETELSGSPNLLISGWDPFKGARDERDRARRRAEEAARRARERRDRLRREAERRTRIIRQQRDRARREAEAAAARVRRERDAAQRKLQEAQKAQRELQQFQNNPTGYVRGKMRQYGVSAGYHRTNKGEIRNNLTQGGWKVIYSKEFGGEEWAKLTACLAGDAFGGAGGCTSAFIKNFVRESYYKTLRGVQNEGVAARKSFQAVLTKKYFAKQMIAAVQGHNIGYPRMNSLEVQFGSATYNRAECLKPQFGGKCAKMPNSHQPYIRYRLK